MTAETRTTITLTDLNAIEFEMHRLPYPRFHSTFGRSFRAFGMSIAQLREQETGTPSEAKSIET
jgi:hypothetical protein